jgi:hypothetical protein
MTADSRADDPAVRKREEPDMSDRRIQKPSLAELFTPKLITILREGYVCLLKTPK